MWTAELQKLVKELHSKVATLEEEVYDWEIKIRKQDFEVSRLMPPLPATPSEKLNKTTTVKRSIDEYSPPPSLFVSFYSYL